MGGHGWENAASSLLISEDVGHFTAQSKMPALHATDWGAKRKAGAPSLSGPQEQSSYFFSKGRWGLFWVFIAQNLKKPKTKNPPKTHDITEKSDLLTHKGTWGLEPVNLWGLRILKIPIKGNCGEVQILEIWMVNNFLKKMLAGQLVYQRNPRKDWGALLGQNTSQSGLWQEWSLQVYSQRHHGK